MPSVVRLIYKAGCPDSLPDVRCRLSPVTVPFVTIHLPVPLSSTNPHGSLVNRHCLRTASLERADSFVDPLPPTPFSLGCNPLDILVTQDPVQDRGKVARPPPSKRTLLPPQIPCHVPSSHCGSSPIVSNSRPGPPKRCNFSF